MIMDATSIWAFLDHPNIHSVLGVATNKTFAPFGALVSPVSHHLL